MIVQIYETRSPAEANELVKVGVDFIGVWVSKKKLGRALDFRQTKEVFDSLPKKVKRVVLTLSTNLDELSELVKKINPDIIHLGARSKFFPPAKTLKLKRLFPSLKIMKAIPVIDKNSIELAKQYEEVVDYLLLDSYKKEDDQVGATGKTHNWDVSREIVKSVKVPVILAGGLGPDNVAEAIRIVNPAGVDSMTKTDKINGKGKDINKVKEFVKIVKSL